MSNPFSRDYKPQIDTADLRKSATSSRHASKSRADRLASDDPSVRIAARGTIPGVSSKEPLSDWERAKIIKKPGNL